MKKRIFRTIRKVTDRIPTAVAVIAIAIFDGLSLAYLVNSSPRFALLKYHFPGTKMIWLFLGVAGMVIAMQLFSIAFERLLGKSRDCRAERRGSTK